ncbi:UspA domain-containing protein [Olsenella uli DSM 7084]|nr:UspA domain-containing protein [Olsenella uli DSM 7084]
MGRTFWEVSDMVDYRDMGYDKIFVSLDGTEQQGEVLERAIILAANNNAELYVGHVIDSTALETAGTYPMDLLESLERDFRGSIAGQVAKAEAEGQIKKVEVTVKAGRIRETLKEEMIDVIEPDLIICGARGLSSIKYALLGSISTFLIRNAKCDTLVVK